MPAQGSISAVPASSVKRKAAPKEDEDDSGSDAGSDVSMINVDFDFYNFNPDVDLIAVKRLLRQNLSHDENQIDVHPLAEFILAEGVRLGVGSTIKTEGEESDPWGMLAVVDINPNRDNPSFSPFLDYLRAHVPSHSPIHVLLSPSLSSAWSNRPALLFPLRLLNLPLPLIPPLYKIMLSELAEGRVERGEEAVPVFTHWLVWGRGYRLEGTEEGMGLDMNQRSAGAGGKKSKNAQHAKNGKTVVPLQSGSFPYHPEEEFLDSAASHVNTWPFKSAPARDEESFGVEQFGRIVLLEGPRLEGAVKAMEEACKQ